jgi:hypothetical protein
MKRKIIKITEDDLKRVIDRVVSEQTAAGFYINEDTEGEETYHYGEDEGEDRKEEERLEDEKEMAPHDRIREIEKHLDALKDDMDYDEDHEDRDEEDTDFSEGCAPMEEQTRKRRILESKGFNFGVKKNKPSKKQLLESSGFNF